jgi:hypothetical protein
MIGLILCLAGAGALIGGTRSLTPSQLNGDLYGACDLVLLRRPFLAMRHARRVYSSGQALFLSTLVTALTLLV